MLTIRLQRVGRTHQPDYRIVLAEKHRSATKKAVEVLGSYNPQSKNLNIKDESRLKYWVSKNVEVSPTVWNLLVSKSLVEGKKVQAWRPKKKEAVEGEESKAETPKVESSGDQKPAEQSKPATEEPKADDKQEAKSEEKKEENPA